jgi:16S rRNA (uracil1498-N3)-methyltransferase
MPRLFLSAISAGITPGSSITVTGDEARYLNNVLRMHRGDALIVFGPDGVSASTRLTGVSKGEVKLEVLEILPSRTETESGIVLVQGLLKKGSKMELVIEKATELGVSAIVPVITRRSQLKRVGKLERWNRIALEAARQSGRTTTPHIHEPVEFKKFIEGVDDKLKGFIFYEEESDDLKITDRPLPENPYILIGPEGGFTSSEVEQAKAVGFISRSLGQNILRAETAAISALTLVSFLKRA